MWLILLALPFGCGGSGASGSGGGPLLYSDLSQGPSGSLVTVWAEGVAAGTVLTCGNAPCEVVRAWATDPNHPAHGTQPARQKIVVRFKSGSNITLAGYNTIPFTLTDGAIREFDPPTVDLSSAGSGDVVYLHGGTYTKSQGGYLDTIVLGKSGVSVIGYPGETAVLDCSSSSAFDAGDSPLSDFTLANVEMDCGGTGSALRADRIGSRTNLRIIGNYIHDARNSNSGAAGTYSTVVDTYIYGNRVERTGVPGENNAHAMYMAGRGASRNFQIKWNTFDTHWGGRAIQFFGHLSGESLDNYDVSYNHISNAQGNAAILFSHSDGGSGAPDDPSKGWLHDGVAMYNTVDGNSGAGIKIMSVAANIQVIGNVTESGNQSILVDFANTVLIQGNCLHKAPTLNQTTGVTLQDNATDYPACLAPE